jgi:Nickel responsive protein SCO4226-like
MKTYVILRRNGWDNPRELEVAAKRSSRVGTDEMSDKVKWIRSYVLDEGNGKLGTVCIYQAVDADALRKHATRAELPADEIILVGETLVVNPDPVETK